MTAVLSQNGSSRSGPWAAYAAAVWALTFSVLHIVWAAGWYVGLNHELARQAFQQRWFLVYDLVVAVVCAVGGVVALGLVQPWGRLLPRAVVGGLGWTGTGLLAIRGGAGAVQTAYFAATGGTWSPRATVWEIWFCVGAALFGLSTRSFWRISRPPRLSQDVRDV